MNKESFLRQKGVNVDAGLNYTGDFETYDEIFSDFMMEFDNQIGNLTTVKESNDMANYAIQVHALKGNLRCLGFDAYADIAYNHEMASKQNDIIINVLDNLFLLRIRRFYHNSPFNRITAAFR